MLTIISFISDENSPEKLLMHTFVITYFTASLKNIRTEMHTYFLKVVG